MESPAARERPPPRPGWTYGLMLLLGIGALGLPVRLAGQGENADLDLALGWAISFWFCAPALPLCAVLFLLRRWRWWDVAVYLLALPLLLAQR